jgi:hypothetical protein
MLKEILAPDWDLVWTQLESEQHLQQVHQWTSVAILHLGDQQVRAWQLVANNAGGVQTGAVKLERAIPCPATLAGREVKTCFMIPPLSEKPSAGVFSFPSGLRFRCFRSRCFGSRRLAGLPVLYFGRERARKSRRGTGGFRYPGAGAV